VNAATSDLRGLADIGLVPNWICPAFLIGRIGRIVSYIVAGRYHERVIIYVI
jgi:hypothetical protein